MYSLYQAMHNLVNTLIYMCNFTVPTYIYKLPENFLEELISFVRMMTDKLHVYLIQDLSKPKN